MNNKIFQNALEWRFEFPEVLDDDGNFTGFDAVIGNPPYIRQEAFSQWKSHLSSDFKIYHSIADLLTYFVEQGYNILKPNGHFMLIISNKFTRANYGQVMRQFLQTKTTLSHFIDFSGVPVFDQATVDVAIVGFKKEVSQNNTFIYAQTSKENFDRKHFNAYVDSIKTTFEQDRLSQSTWTFENPKILAIKRKVETHGTPLKDWNITISRGILTGYNEAFVIDGKTKDALVAEDPKSAEILKPLLRGRDVQKWQADYQDLWLIATFPNKSYNIDDFPAVKNYLLTFGKRLEQSGEKGSRKKTTNKWFETQDNIAYWQDFEKPKIIYPNMTKFLPFALDREKLYTNQKCFILCGDKLEYLVSFFNSRLFRFCFRDNFPELLGGTRELSKVFFDKIPVKQVSEEEELPFKDLVTEILVAKNQNPAADVTALEAQIDHLVYELYGLTEAEIQTVENT